MTSFVNRLVTVKEGIIETTACIVADQDTLAIHPAATAYAYYLANEKGSPKNTILTYMSTVSNFLTFVANDPKLRGFEDVEDVHVRAYIEGVILKHMKLSPSTANQRISHIENFYKFCFERGFTEHIPRVYLSESAKRILDEQKGKASSIDPYDLPTQYTTEAEFRDLCSYITAKRSYESSRDEIVLNLGYLSGLRAHEVTLTDNLTISKIEKAVSRSQRENNDGFEIHIMGKGDKSREIFVPEALKRMIQRFLAGPRKNVPGDLLICKNDGSSLDSEHASNVFSSAKKALIDADKAVTSEFWRKNNEKRSFHSLRHSYATNLADFCKKNGLSYKLLADRLGHEGDGRAQQTLTYIHFAAKKRGDAREADSIATRIISNVTRYRTNG